MPDSLHFQMALILGKPTKGWLRALASMFRVVAFIAPMIFIPQIPSLSSSWDKQTRLSFIGIGILIVVIFISSLIVYILDRDARKSFTGKDIEPDIDHYLEPPSLKEPEPKPSGGWSEIYNAGRATSDAAQRDFQHAATSARAVVPLRAEAHEKPKFDSPIEEMFWNEWQTQGGPDVLDLTYQYWVEGTSYRVDFAHLPSKTAIELDGYEYHTSKDQFTRDRKRERQIERLGWRVIRFSGSEINASPANCLTETLRYILANSPTARLGRVRYVARSRPRIVAILKWKIRNRIWRRSNSDRPTVLEEMYNAAAKDIAIREGPVAGLLSTDPDGSAVWKEWLDRIERQELQDSL